MANDTTVAAQASLNILQTERHRNNLLFQLPIHHPEITSFPYTETQVARPNCCTEPTSVREYSPSLVHQHHRFLPSVTRQIAMSIRVQVRLKHLVDFRTPKLPHLRPQPSQRLFIYYLSAGVLLSIGMQPLT